LKKALPEISIPVEPGRDRTDAQALVGKLQQKFETALALRVSVVLVPPGTLPRAELKAKRWKVDSKSG